MMHIFKKASRPVVLSKEHVAPAEQIHDVLVVGAFEGRCAYGATDCEDSINLTQFIDAASPSGLIRMKDGKPDIDVRTMNLHEGGDFLTDFARAQLVMFMFMPGFHKDLGVQHMSVREAVASCAQVMAAEKDHAVSELHTVENFRRSLQASGALAYVTVGGRDEINTTHFEKMPVAYEVVQENSNSTYSMELLAQKHRFPGLSRCFGFALRHDFLERAAYSSLPNTEINKRIQSLQETREIESKPGIAATVRGLIRRHTSYDVSLHSPFVAG